MKQSRKISLSINKTGVSGSSYEDKKQAFGDIAC